MSDHGKLIDEIINNNNDRIVVSDRSMVLYRNNKQ